MTGSEDRSLAIREYAESKTATRAGLRFNEIQKLATQYSGLDLTPGILAELMGLLHGMMADEKIKNLFPKETDNRVMELSSCAGEGLRKLSGRGDGFPVGDLKTERKPPW